MCIRDRPYTAQLTHKTSNKLAYSFYSLDFATSDFHFFGLLKGGIMWYEFYDNVKIEENVLK